MRQIGNGLRYFFESVKADFVQQQGEQNRCCGTKEQSDQTDADGIDHGLSKDSVCECFDKIIESDKFTLPYRQCKGLWFYLLECHRPSPEWYVLKDDQPDQKRH